jgi:hypothetical protein
MNAFASALIATFGGSTAVARFTDAPVSTVHSWKHNGIPSSRLAHLRLIAEKEEIAVDWDTGLPLGTAAVSPSPNDDAAEWPIQSATKSDEIIRDQEGAPGRPFLPSSATSSPTSAPRQPSPESLACSAGRADAA